MPAGPSPGEENLFARERANRETSFHLADYLHVLRRRWQVVAAFTAVTLSGGALHYAVTPKEYRAATVIQIERRSMTSVTGQQNPWLENYWNLEYYPTQYRLIQSRGMAERVVKNLRLLEDPAFGGRPAATAGARPSGADDQAALGGLAGRLLGGLEVIPIPNTQLVEIGFHDSSPEFAAKVANGFADAYIDWGIDTRSANATKASSFLTTQIASLKQEIQDKEKQLQSYSRTSDILSTVGGKDGETTSVVGQRMESLNADYAQAVSQRIDKSAELKEIETSPPEAIADTLSGGLVGELRAEQIRNEREYATKLNTYKPDWPAMVELKAKIDKGRQNLDGVIQETVAKARERARGEYQTALRREQALSDELNRTKLDALAQNSATVEFNNLQMEIATRRALLDQLLTRQSETDVAGRLQGTRDSNVSVVDRALVPGGAFRPSLKQDLSMGFLFGLMLGVGCVVLLEYLDRTIKTSDEAERLLGMPVLATIPDVSDNSTTYGYGGYGYGYGYGARRRRHRESGSHAASSAGIATPDGAESSAGSSRDSGTTTRALKRRELEAEIVSIELLPHSKPRLVASESYRALRTALLLSSAEELKVVAITSTQSGEGKSATATNLAVVMAQLGRRVLLLDADLRKPRLHDIFKISNRIGVVSYLTGTARPEQICQATEVPGLWVAPSGPIPPNPSELLASDRMRELVRQVRGAFDFVLIDTPPALAVTDPTLVGAIVDGVVLCLRSRKVQRDDARLCSDRLRIADIRVLGAVLNRYREGQGSRDKRYGHYVAYAYGDGETGERGSAA